MRKIFYISLSILVVITIAAFKSTNIKSRDTKQVYNDSILFAGEKHFKNIQQLTFGGDNAEAYWSYDSKYLIFQRTDLKQGILCDEMFVGKVPTKPGEKFSLIN